MITTAITPISLGMKEIGPGVAEVYAGDYQVGMITWNPEQMTSLWYATYANGDSTVPCANRHEALNMIRVQHAAVQRLVRSIRSIRPARTNCSGIQLHHELGYNSALRDVEHLLTEVAGQAKQGEGYTAITE